MNTILEIFDQYEIALILEALDHRRRYYKNRIPQAETNSACGGTRPYKTLMKYRKKEKNLEEIISKWVENTI